MPSTDRRTIQNVTPDQAREYSAELRRSAQAMIDRAAEIDRAAKEVDESFNPEGYAYVGVNHFVRLRVSKDAS